MTGPHHLVAVWNPSYERDALALHLDVLLSRMKAVRAAGRDDEDDDAFVWWGKVRSRNRQSPLPHAADLLALDGEIAASLEQGIEHHLYLTDYRSLSVAHLAEVRAGDDASVLQDTAHMPPYYAARGFSSDCWFKLWDIRRVVVDDTPAVQAELAKLRNVRYHDRPVSLYGGMTDLPLIVTRADTTPWFDPDARDQLTGGRHWAEFDGDTAGTGVMEAELRDHRFGASLWTALDPLARRFIATAEQLYRAHWREAGFDLGVVVLNLAKAVEVQLTVIVRAALREAPPAIRMVNVEGSSVDLADGRALSLGEMARALTHDRARMDWVASKLTDGKWLVEEFAAYLGGELAPMRNRAAHPGAVTPEEAGRARARLVGVGSAGELLRLAGVGVRAKR